MARNGLLVLCAQLPKSPTAAYSHYLIQSDGPACNNHRDEGQALDIGCSKRLVQSVELVPRKKLAAHHPITPYMYSRPTALYQRNLPAMNNANRLFVCERLDVGFYRTRLIV
jgi:hypothetical protein